MALLGITAFLCLRAPQPGRGCHGNGRSGSAWSERWEAPLPCPALASCALVSGSCLLQLPAPSTGPESSFPALSPRTDFPPAGVSGSNSFFFIFPSALSASLNVLFLLWFLSVPSPQRGLSHCHHSSRQSALGQSSPLTLSLLFPVSPYWGHKHLLSPFS